MSIIVIFTFSKSFKEYFKLIDLLVITNFKSNHENLKAHIKTYIIDSNKCLSLHDQRDSVGFLFNFLFNFALNNICFVIQLLKSQLAETRLKCELLEQSLRVLAQENHDLEVKKLHDPNYRSVRASRNASPSPASAKLSTEDEIGNDAGLEVSISESNDLEEFFDIGKTLF